MSSYKNALEIDPNSFFTNYNIGVLLSLDKNKHAEAFEFLMKALDQAHRAGEVLYELNVLINLALIHEFSELYEEALEFLETAIKLDPNN
jgi:tetratricopeptide (TPR) repeat protein